MSTLTYYNPNPKYKPSKTGKPKRWHLGDCAVRAVCAATGMKWVDAYSFMSNSALKVYEPFNCGKGFDQCMKDLGFVRMSYPRGEKRETVEEFADNHRNQICILNLAGHYVCCKEGSYFDVWDCGDCTAYSYYVLPKR